MTRFRTPSDIHHIFPSRPEYIIFVVMSVDGEVEIEKGDLEVGPGDESLHVVDGIDAHVVDIHLEVELASQTESLLNLLIPR